MDLASARFSNRLQEVLARVERIIRGRLLTMPIGESAVDRGVTANQLQADIRQAVLDAGWEDLKTKAFSRVLDQLTTDILSGSERSASVARRLEALRILAEESVWGQRTVLGDALWRAVARGVFTGRPVPALLDDISEVVDRTRPQIETLYDTSVSIYGRQVEALTADPGPDVRFRYLGPDDDVVRPFCRERVGKTYPRGEIDQMDNGQIPDVFLTGGGYNCRHSWIEVSRFSEAS